MFLQARQRLKQAVYERLAEFGRRPFFQNPDIQHMADDAEFSILIGTDINIGAQYLDDRSPGLCRDQFKARSQVADIVIVIIGRRKCFSPVQIIQASFAKDIHL